MSWLAVSQAAERLGVSSRQVQNLVASGELRQVARGVLDETSVERHAHDAVLGIMLEAGFSATDAVQAYSMLDSFIYGFVLQEQQHGIAAPADTQQAAHDLLAGLTADELPHLRTVAEAISAGPALSHDDAFAHGLRIILDGLRPESSDPTDGASRR